MPALRSWLTIALCAVGIGACYVPDADFTELDAREDVDATDAPAGSLMLVVSASTLTVDELGEGTFAVTLSQPPAAPVFVTIESSDELVLAARPSLLVFEAATWNDAQAVTVTGRDDLDALDDNGGVTLSSSAAGGASVAVTVRDDDKLQIETTPASSLQVDEGATTPVGVKLRAMPAADVVVDIVSVDPAIAAVAPGTLTFTASNWNVAQDVLVTGVQDPEADHEDTTIGFTSPGPIEVADSTLAVHVVDDEILGIVPSLTNLGTLVEGGTTTFTVRMNLPVTADLDVAVTSSDVAALAVSPASLRFTTATWNMPQTITVTVPQDPDVVDETPSIMLSTTATGVDPRLVSVAIDDDDVQDIIASPSSVAVVEAATAPVAVSLKYEPAAPITLSVTSLAPSTATVTPSTVTFTPIDYATPQTVMVRGADDQDAASGTTTVHLESLAVQLTKDVPVAVTDDDRLEIETDTTAVSLVETMSATFQVRLRAAPVGTLTVIPTSGDVSAATVSPAMLSFTAANWNAYQTVTVTGVHDADVATDVVAIALGSPMTPSVSVTATVTDIDQQTIVAGPTTLTVEEGMTGTVGVRLMQQPSAPVVVTATSSAMAAATVAPASLTFTSANYATVQNLTITGVDDVNTTPETATITLASTGLTSIPVAVTITDPDVVQIALSASTLSINEASSGTLGVRLTAQPSANVTVNVSSSDTGAATATPATLTFTPVNWSTTQNVTVTGVDDLDVANENVTVTFGASGLATVTAAITVIDDEVLGMVTSVPSVSMTEPTSTTFQVRLSQMPGGNVTIDIASADPGAATVSPASLTFTTQNWGANQTVTVQSVSDLDTADESVAIALTGTNVTPASVTAAIADDDQQSIQLSAATLGVVEGSSGTVTVRLAYQPPGSVTVTSSSANAALATASPATFTFTPANYATPQTLTIAGVEDPDAAPGTTTVSLTSPGLVTASVAVTVTDNDPLDITTSVGSLTIAEAGSAGVGVKLTAQPPGNITVAVASSDIGAATAAPTTLTFTTANWDVFQNVTVAGVDDVDAAAESVTLTLSGSGVTTKTVAVTVTDDDPLTIVASLASVSLTENGTATFNVHLGAQPQATTAVTVTSSDTGAATVSPASLSFTTASWATDQVVTVTGVDDADMVAETVAVSLAATGLTTVMVTANVSDPDQQQVIATPSTLTVNEGGTGVVAVRLAFQPAANTTVTVSLDSSIATSSAATLTFTPANYATTQNLTITGVQDPDGIDDTTTLSLTATGATSGSVALTINDDEILDILTSVSTISVNEGGTATLQVKLSSQPSATTTVSLSTVSPSEASASPASLSFTTTNWNTYQTVTITGVQDADTANETTTFNATATGWTTAAVPITVYDNDTIAPFSTMYVMYEGEPGIVMQVHLTAQPAGNVVVGVASSDTGALTVSAASLTFTPTNWSTNQAVTFTGVDDADTTNESVNVALTATGQTTQNVAVTVHDNDTISLSTGSIVVGEGNQTTFTVRLLAQPRETKTVGVSLSDATVATMSPTSLNFTTTNWSSPQTVTVTGTGDSDRVNDATTLFASATNLSSKSATLSVYEYYFVTIDAWTDNGGTGTVTGTGINCTVPGTGACQASVLYGSTYALHESFPAGNAFWGWTNCDPWWAADCSLTVTGDVTVRAQFPRTATLSVTKTGNGLVKDPDYTALDCGPICSWAYHWPVINIRTQATPDPGWSFAYWTGACAGQGSICTLSFDVNTSTHAVFTSP